MDSASILVNQYVRHNTRPQWGLGYVTAASDHVHVMFTDGQTRKFQKQHLGNFLTVVAADDVAADHPMTTPEGRRSIQALSATQKTSAKQPSPSRKQQKLAELAVFSRNYDMHVNDALAIHATNPEQEITFRASTRWVSPAQAVHHGMTPTIYLAKVDGGGDVLYMGQLKRVLVDPQPDDALTQELLNLGTESTRNEGLWDGEAKTLYTITHLHCLTEPFHMTELIKWNDRTPVDENYSRAYCLVCHRDTEMTAPSDPPQQSGGS